MVQDLTGPASGQLEPRRGGAGVRIDDGIRLGPEPPPQLGFALHQDHLGAGIGSGQSGRHSRGSASYDGNFRVLVLVLVMGRLPGRMLEAAQAGEAANDRFGQPPHQAWPDQGLVVEAHRHQKIQPLDQGQEIPPRRRPAVLGPHLVPVLDRLHASAHVGRPVDVHEAVGTVARDAEQTAGPVILEAAGKDAHSGRQQGRGHRVPRMGFAGLPVKTEAEPQAAVQELSRFWPQSSHGALQSPPGPVPGSPSSWGQKLEIT